MYRLRLQNLVILFPFLFATALHAQTKQIKVEPVQPTVATTGDALYREFCAVCHGVNGKGNGPAAEALKSKPSDLTQISRRNNGKFPTIAMMHIVGGQDAVTAHGSQDMPTWGDAFKSISANAMFAEMRIRALVEYLQKIQN